jgi:predicted TIM-barrel fold metal-dependent hydrolase
MAIDETGSAQDKGMLVVDVDVHLHELPKALAPYCEMPWRRALECLEDIVPDRYLDLPGFSPSLELDAPFPDGLALRIAESPEQMREGLDMLGIDIAILFPDHLLKLAMLPDMNYATALARAYNRWMVDHWLVYGKGLKGALVAAPQNPEATAHEIESYAREPNVVAVYLPAAGVDPLYGNRCYDPIYQAAQDANMPVLLHSVEAVFPVFPFQLQKYETSLARHAIAHPFAMMANMISLLNTGVPVRFPRLKIAFVEGGVSWVPFMMYRLDKEYTERRREVPFLQDRPSTYIKRFHYGTQPIEEPERMRDLVSLFQLYGGEDNTMFASDWPHHDFDHPTKVLQAPFSEEAKRKIMGQNAVRFFNLEV